MSKRPWLRVAGAVLVILYLVTWAFGVPCVLSGEAARAARAYGAAREYVAAREYGAVSARQGLEVREVHPQIRFDFALPILPGVMLVKHGYQAANLSGERGWSVFAWWGAGNAKLASMNQFT